MTKINEINQNDNLEKMYNSTYRWHDVKLNEVQDVLKKAAVFHSNQNIDYASQLKKGKEIYFQYANSDGTGYTKIRIKNFQPVRKQTEMVMCDCGHSVSKTMVMNSSTGTCCPDCYDSMSD